MAAASGLEPGVFAMLRDYAAMVTLSESLTPDKVFAMGVLIGVAAGRKDWVSGL